MATTQQRQFLRLNKRIVAAIAILGLALSLAQIGHGQGDAPTETKVVSIKIEGNNLVPTELIRKSINTREGAPYERPIVEEDVRRLFSLGFFSDVRCDLRPTPSGKLLEVELLFAVIEYPNAISAIQFRGGKHLNRSETYVVPEIRKGFPLNPTINKMATRNILDDYHLRGYAFAKVELAEGGKQTDQRVVFEIDEGPLVRVRSIRVEGDPDLVPAAREYLDKNVKEQRGWPCLSISHKGSDGSSTSAPLIGWVWHCGSIYQEDDASFAAGLLESIFDRRGQPDVHVSSNVTFSDDRSSADVIFTVNRRK